MTYKYNIIKLLFDYLLFFLRITITFLLYWRITSKGKHIFLMKILQRQKALFNSE